MKRPIRFASRLWLVPVIALTSLPGCGGKDSTPPTQVTPTVATVTVSPSANPLLTGGTATLTATARDASGNTMSGQSFTWTTDVATIASVTQSGVVTAVAPGSATITASTAGKSGTATVTVTAPVLPVATVTITPSTPSLIVNGTVALAAEPKDAAGAVLTGRAIAWSSNAQAIATVSQAGVVTAVASGSATITATSEGRSGTATITVTNPFNPTTSGTLSGTQRYTSINIPAGVTITASGDLNLSASGPIAITGTLAGNCVAMTVTADLGLSITGAISNACTDVNADGKDLTIVGKGGVSVAGTSINSSGDIYITNDLTLTEANFPAPTGALLTAVKGIRVGLAARQALVSAAVADCRFASVRPAPPVARPGIAGATQLNPGSSGKGLRMWCRGNGEVGGGLVNATVTAQSGGIGGAGNSTSNTFAEARAGDGGNGGTLRVFATGNLDIIGPTTFVSGDGGDGGTAIATAQSNPNLNKQPNAQATGGKGGEPGLIDVRAGGALNLAAALNIVIGRAGNGGDATATGAPGLDANDISPAKEGGDANPTGGEGGGTPNRSLTAFGSVFGAGAALVSGGRAGNAGRATGTAGNGGKGNEKFSAGGKGGNLSFNTNNAANGVNTRVGNGGSALLRNILGLQFGRGGDGSITTGTVGNGGAGWNGCSVLPHKAGGAGGAGGSVSGRDGTFGTGLNNGIAGGLTLTTVGNGGKGGNGTTPGVGGNGGTDASVVTGARNLVAPNFTRGANGVLCGPLPVKVSVLSDPNVHDPFTKFSTVDLLDVIIEGNKITIIGPAPWVTLTGTLDGNNFTATGTGTVAGYPNVPIRFTGSINTEANPLSENGTIAGTIQVGQTAQPTGLPNGPVTYKVEPGVK